MTDSFERLQKHSRAVGEWNDCTVKALAITARVGYKTAHKALKDAGRQDRKGAHVDQQVKAVEALGYKLVAEQGAYDLRNRRQDRSKAPRQPNGSAYTPATIGKLCAKGRWMVWTDGHVLAVVNGKVIDWTEGRRHRVKHIARVVKA